MNESNDSSVWPWARLAGAVALSLLVSGCSSVTRSPVAGTWSAWLDGPGGEVPFIIDIAEEETGMRAWIVMADGLVEIPRVYRDGDNLILSMAEGGPSIRAEADEAGNFLCGEWTPSTGSPLVFAAEAGLPCLPGGRAEPTGLLPASGLAGDYEIQLSKTAGQGSATFHVAQEGHAEGKLPTGSSGPIDLRGGVVGTTLQLAGFDGHSACVLRGQASPGGGFEGYYWISNQGLGTWHAITK